MDKAHADIDAQKVTVVPSFSSQQSAPPINTTATHLNILPCFLTGMLVHVRLQCPSLVTVSATLAPVRRLLPHTNIFQAEIRLH